MSALGESIKELRSEDKVRIEVPEWGKDGKPLVFYSGLLRCNEVLKIQRKHKNFLSEMTTGNPNIEAVVEMLIIKAVDNDNKPIFDIGDKPILLREPVNVLMDVIGRMFTTVPNIEELEKN